MTIGCQQGHLISFVRGKDSRTASGIFCWVGKTEEGVCVCVCAHVGGKMGI